MYYTGLDMEFGGDGMKSFYDKELVSLANKISKKIGGGKVQPYTLELTVGMDANSRHRGDTVEACVTDLAKLTTVNTYERKQ